MVEAKKFPGIRIKLLPNSQSPGSIDYIFLADVAKPSFFFVTSPQIREALNAVGKTKEDNFIGDMHIAVKGKTAEIVFHNPFGVSKSDIFSGKGFDTLIRTRVMKDLLKRKPFLTNIKYWVPNKNMIAQMNRLGYNAADAYRGVPINDFNKRLREYRLKKLREIRAKRGLVPLLKRKTNTIK